MKYFLFYIFFRVFWGGVFLVGTRSQVELVSADDLYLHVCYALHMHQMSMRSAGVECRMLYMVSKHSTSGAVSPAQGLLL